MAAVNLSALANIAPYQFNDSLFTDSTQIASNTLSTTQSVTNDYYLISILIALYIAMVAILMFRREGNLLDFLSANIYAAGTSTVLAGLGLILGFTNSYNDVSFFGTLLFLFFVGKYLYNLKFR